MTKEVDAKPYELGISPNDVGSYSLLERMERWL